MCYITVAFRFVHIVWAEIGFYIFTLLMDDGLFCWVREKCFYFVMEWLLVLCLTNFEDLITSIIAFSEWACSWKVLEHISITENSEMCCDACGHSLDSSRLLCISSESVDVNIDEFSVNMWLLFFNRFRGRHEKSDGNGIFVLDFKLYFQHYNLNDHIGQLSFKGFNFCQST